MAKVIIRFYEELNDFIPKQNKKERFEVTFIKGCTIKALIEDLGVPHTEVDLILVNGASVAFSYKLAEGDRISVYPVFESLDIGAISRVRPQPLRTIKFILDVHLGKLAAYLRMLGFDSLYTNSYTDEELTRKSHQEKRIILTRDRGLLKRKTVTHACLVRSQNAKMQLHEVVHRLDLLESMKPFTLCLKCNRSLEKVSTEIISSLVPQGVLSRNIRYALCPSCKRIYWRGSHWEDMNRFINLLCYTSS